MKKIIAAMVAVTAVSFTGLAATALDYVQDGLIAHWDGVENAGNGVHDSSATTWKNLAGEMDLTLWGNAVFTDNSIYRSASSYSMAYGDASMASAKTMQIVFKRKTAGEQFAVVASLKGYGSNGEGLLAIKQSGIGLNKVSYIGSNDHKYHYATEAANGEFTTVTLLVDSDIIYTNAGLSAANTIHQ